MAVIGKIQKNSLLLLIVIGLAMLAFIFTDFLKGGPSQEERIPTATLYGESIDEDEYKVVLDGYVNRSKNDYAYQGKEWDDNAQKSAETSAFNEMIRRSLLNAEFDKLGIVCTSDELNDMVHGDHIHPWVKSISAFTGGDGAFSRDSIRNFLNQLEVEPAGATTEQRQIWLDRRQQWKDFEDELQDSRRADKYVALIKKGVYVNKLEVQDKYQALNRKREVRYVIQPYSIIPVDEVQVTDEDIKGYYEKNKNHPDYKQEEARDVQMVFFDIPATAADKENTELALAGTKKLFKTSPNPIGYVFQNSDSKLLSDSTVFKYSEGDRLVFSPNNTKGGSYPKNMDDSLQMSKVGDVFGPVLAYNSDLQRNELAIVKVLEKPTEKQAWVRHILISTGATRSDERAKAISDSLVKVIKRDNNFAALVPVVSEDPGSKDKGGEYKWFAEGVMVPEFNKASFEGQIGQIQLVKTSFGYHIVEVLGQADRATPVLAVVTKEVKPSENTIRDVQSRAYDFIYRVSDSKQDSAFNVVANDSNMTAQSTRIFLSNDYILGLGNSEKMLKYAFDANTDVGTISDPILDGYKYVVAIVDNKIEEGTPDFEDVKEVMRLPALKEKQADIYVKKMSGMNSLEEIAKVTNTGTIQKATVSFDSKSISTGNAAEPGVIGKLFKEELVVGAMSKPIAGKEGIYVFIIDSETPAEETSDYAKVKAPMLVKRAQSSDAKVIQALREKADLIDNRRRIKYQ